jgi:hypothetical protein
MWGALFSAERHQTPVIRLALQPCAIRKTGHPVNPDDLENLNRFRAMLDLLPLSGDNGLEEKDVLATISLFPRWFGTPQSEWDESGASVGFPLPPPLLDDGIAADVSSFVDRFGSPVAFSCGTGVQRVRYFLDVAIELARVGHPVVFLSRYAGQRPGDMPENIILRDYVDHGALFPRVGLVIHNGGIGVIAQAIRASVPQIIVPLMYDQPDNALRVEHLGLGCTIPPNDFRLETLKSAVERLGSDRELPDRLRRVAADVSASAAIWKTADLIEGLIASA